MTTAMPIRAAVVEWIAPLLVREPSVAMGSSVLSLSTVMMVTTMDVETVILRALLQASAPFVATKSFVLK